MCARCDCEWCRDPAAPHQALIPSLAPYTKYEVLVNPFNKVGPGPASAKAIVSTLEGGECSVLRYTSGLSLQILPLSYHCSGSSWADLNTCVDCRYTVDAKYFLVSSLHLGSISALR